ncbi:MAG TPA: T9SS type A sorting domain-containing protein, partial [Bacteroidia bacterium]|nr:T9SS type A sorting domain-containing protein [Bacteroidia bacterium]
GINEIQSSAISVYPNPATDFINVALPESQTETSYSILDLSGKIVDQGKMVIPQGKSFSVNLSQSLKEGIYFIEVSNGVDSYKHKFVKIKN